MKKLQAKLAEKHVSLLPFNGLKKFAWILWGFLNFHVFYLWLQVRRSGVTLHYIDIFVTLIKVNILRWVEGPSCCHLTVMSLWIVSYIWLLTPNDLTATPQKLWDTSLRRGLSSLKLSSFQHQRFKNLKLLNIGNIYRFFDLWPRVTRHRAFIVSSLQEHIKTHQPYKCQVLMCRQSVVIRQTTYLLIWPLTSSDVTQNQSPSVFLYLDWDASPL